MVNNCSSTCFGRLYVHHQEVGLRYTAYGFLSFCSCCDAGESGGKLCALVHTACQLVIICTSHCNTQQHCTIHSKSFHVPIMSTKKSWNSPTETQPPDYFVTELRGLCSLWVTNGRFMPKLRTAATLCLSFYHKTSVWSRAESWQWSSGKGKSDTQRTKSFKLGDRATFHLSWAVFMTNVRWDKARCAAEGRDWQDTCIAAIAACFEVLGLTVFTLLSATHVLAIHSTFITICNICMNCIEHVCEMYRACMNYIQRMCELYIALVLTMYSTGVNYIQHVCELYTVSVWTIYSTCVNYIQHV